jgi:hypothetical protein
MPAGADARMNLIHMEQALSRWSALRRATQQLCKSRRRFSELISPLGQLPPPFNGSHDVRSRALRHTQLDSPRFPVCT